MNLASDDRSAKLNKSRYPCLTHSTLPTQQQRAGPDYLYHAPQMAGQFLHLPDLNTESTNARGENVDTSMQNDADGNMGTEGANQCQAKP